MKIGMKIEFENRHSNTAYWRPEIYRGRLAGQKYISVCVIMKHRFLSMTLYYGKRGMFA